MKRALGQAVVLVLVMVLTAGATLWITGRDRVTDTDGNGGLNGQTGSEDVVDSGDIVLTSALQPFGDCQTLRDHFVEHALEQVGPYGLGGYGMPVDATAAAESSGGARGAQEGGDVAESSAAAAAADSGVSGTNVQEAGVDESDIVKADERMLVTVTPDEHRLRIMDLTGTTPRPAGSLELPESWQQELFLAGDRVLVISGATATHIEPRGAVSDIGMVAATSTSTLTLVDVADMDAPRIVSTLELDGSHVSARLVDGVARVVMRSGPVGLAFVVPEGGGLNAERQATETNRRIVTDSTIDNWLPAYVRRDAGGDIIDEGRLLDCADVHRPEDFAGLGLTTVLSVDIGADFVPRGGSAVITGGDIVYASPTGLFVATQTWAGSGVEFGPVDSDTSIHRFSLEDASQAVYTGSGNVRGRLLNQWAMSERDGYLRVATTTGQGEASQSSLVVLSAGDGDLDEVGRVDGLGVTEQIYAVRYLEERAYVVTFRQTDPLYVLDLSDPTSPQVAGELKIPGFSSYLHPVGDGRLIGVGQDATLEGMTTGLQVSLFDVTDPAAPRRLDTLDLGQGYSPVQQDHRAFLYWDPERLAVLPVERYEMPVEPLPDVATPGADGVVPEPRELVKPFLGAVAVRVDGGQLTTVAELSHGDGTGAEGAWNPIMRSQVVAGQLLTVGPLGVGYGPVDDVGQRAFVAYR